MFNESSRERRLSRLFPLFLLAAVLVALAGLFAHSALPALAQQPGNLTLSAVLYKFGGMPEGNGTIPIRKEK